MIQFAVMAVMAIAKGVAARKKRKAIARQKEFENEKRKGQERVRVAGNEFKAAEAGLNRFAQSLNNQKRLEAGGKAQSALLENAARGREAEQVGNFERTIRSSEDMGNNAARAAASGSYGSVVDMIAVSTALRDDRIEGQLERNRVYKDRDTARRASEIMTQTAGNLDNRSIYESLDYGFYMPDDRPNGPSVLGAAIQGAVEGYQMTSGMSGSFNFGGTASKQGAYQSEYNNTGGQGLNANIGSY